MHPIISQEALQDFEIIGKFRKQKKKKNLEHREIESNESTRVDWKGVKKIRRGG